MTKEAMKQEPVAWLVEFENGEQELHFEEQSVGETQTPLYPPAQPIIKSYLEKDNSAQQEPVATLWQHGETGRTRITMPGDITDCDARWFKAADLYTSPPAQRTWVGLTDEDWDEISDMPDTFDQGVAWAQARLKEKNT